MQACNMTLDVEMHVKQDMLIITPDRGHRKSWDLKFSNSKGIAQDELLLDTISDLDSEEWEW